MIFIRVRLNYKGAALFESLPAKIKTLLSNNPGETFDIEVADVPVDVKLPISERELRKFRKSVQKFGPDDLTHVGELIRFKDDSFAIELKEDGSIEIHNTNESRIANFKSFEKTYESLIRQHNLDQLKMLRKMTKGIDIGDRVPNLKTQGANIHFMHNPIDSGVESFEDFEKNNKGFIPSWNSTHKMGPFDGRKSS